MDTRLGWFRSGGLVIAIIGFAITRIFVAETLQVEESVMITLISVAPLISGLGLTIYGVALAFGPFSRVYVNKVTQWCVLGTAGMLSILLVTMSGPILEYGSNALFVDDTRLIIANVLLGGAVGGVIIGDRSASNQRHRQETRRQANRGQMLTRLLRHEVINAATIIRGYATNLRDDIGQPKTAILSEASRITETVDEVEKIAADPPRAEEIDLKKIVTEEVESIQAHYPAKQITVDLPTDSVAVDADDRVRIIIRELLENACEHGEVSSIDVIVEIDNGIVSLRIIDDGPGLPSPQQALLESGSFPEYDDPGAGFGLQIVRILLSKYDAEVSIETQAKTGGTTIEISLPRHGYSHGLQESISIAFSNLLLSIVAGIVAGLAMGLYFAFLTDTLPVIGALYGVENLTVGWITHLFHSVVFALLFSAGMSYSALQWFEQRPIRTVGAAIAWGAILWLVAAGIIMPLWLRAIGESAIIPALSPPGLVSHLLWGLVLGVMLVGMSIMYRN